MTRRFLPRWLLLLALPCFSSAALSQSASRLKAIELVKEAATVFGRGDLSLAIKICRQALSLDPGYPRAYTYLGAAYQKRGERQNACVAFNRVLQLAPRTPDATRATRGIRELSCTLPTRRTSPSPRLSLRPNLRIESRWNAVTGIAALAFSRDSSQIEGGGKDGAWHLWRASDGRLDRLERGNDSAATSIAVGPNFSVVGYGNGTLRLFDARQRGETARIDARSGSIAGLAYAPGGAMWAATGGDGAIKIFDGRTNALLHAISGEGLLLSGVAFSPDARYIAAGVGSGVRIYDSRSGRLIRTLTGDGLPVAALAWSRSGLLAGATGYKIRVWNGATGRLERVLSGHRLAISALAFGVDNTLASGGYDNQLRVWNAGTGTGAAFSFHGAQISALSFDAGGKRLVSGDQNGLVGVWRVF